MEEDGPYAGGPAGGDASEMNESTKMMAMLLKGMKGKKGKGSDGCGGGKGGGGGKSKAEALAGMLLGLGGGGGAGVGALFGKGGGGPAAGGKGPPRREPASRFADGAGDWSCEICGDHNFARNAQCRKCGAPRPEGAGEAAYGYGGGGGGSSGAWSAPASQPRSVTREDESVTREDESNTSSWALPPGGTPWSTPGWKPVNPGALPVPTMIELPGDCKLIQSGLSQNPIPVVEFEKADIFQEAHNILCDILDVCRLADIVFFEMAEVDQEYPDIGRVWREMGKVEQWPVVAKCPQFARCGIGMGGTKVAEKASKLALCIALCQVVGPPKVHEVCQNYPIFEKYLQNCQENGVDVSTYL